MKSFGKEMANYKLYVDKSTSFECRIQLQGASLKNAQARLIVVSEDANLLYEGKIERNGKCTIPIGKLRGVLDEDSKGTLKLEVIADDTYFQPWKSPFVVKTSKKLRVEVVQQKAKKATMIVEIHPPDRLVEFIARELKKKGITSETVLKKKAYVTRLVKESVKKSGSEVDMHLLISRVVNKLT